MSLIQKFTINIISIVIIQYHQSNVNRKHIPQSLSNH